MGRKTGKAKSKGISRHAILPYATIGVVLLLLLAAVLWTRIGAGHTVKISNNSSSGKTSISGIAGFNISGALLTPPSYLAGSPVINTSMIYGHRLTGINRPFNSSELSVINQAPDSYFEDAGRLYLNGSYFTLAFYSTFTQVPTFVVNGKPSVIYLGSITCFYCAQGRWAMALALSRFGNFSALYNGYSSFGDGNLPTIYWSPANYSGSSVDLGSFYSSNYINFIAIDDTSPITAGFYIHPLSTIQREINSTGNLAYEDAIKFIIGLNNFESTPYTIWGNGQLNGADAIDVGNVPESGNLSGQATQLEFMTQAGILGQLQNPNDQFAWGEYAAADLYVANICLSLNNSAPVCDLPVMPGIERVILDQRD